MGLQTENLILSSKLVKLLESHEREYVKFSSGHIEKFIVKPQYQMALHENLTKWSALDKYCVQNGWGLLITDGYRSIQKFQQHEFSMEFQIEKRACVEFTAICVEAESTIFIPRILTVGIIVISYWIVTNRNRGDAT